MKFHKNRFIQSWVYSCIRTDRRKSQGCWNTLQMSACALSCELCKSVRILYAFILLCASLRVQAHCYCHFCVLKCTHTFNLGVSPWHTFARQHIIFDTHIYNHWHTAFRQELQLRLNNRMLLRFSSIFKHVNVANSKWHWPWVSTYCVLLLAVHNRPTFR